MNQALFSYIAASPTAFQAVDHTAKLLELEGYRPLRETEEWTLEPGGRYYVTRNCSSLIAFRLPHGRPGGFMMTAAHSDSPTFKIKENAELAGESDTRLSVEGYGGMLCASWMDRPLSIAGRAMVRTENGIAMRLVDLKDIAALIPNVAIHMNREMNRGVEYNPQVDLLPLLADVSFDEYDAHTTYDAQTASENAEEQPEAVEKPTLVALAAETAGVDAETILGEDLFLYTRQEGKMIGAKGEFVLSPRLDDLQSAFALTKAFTESTPAEYINVCAVFDNEEVGSGTRQGADSTFLEDILQRIAEGLQADHSSYLRWVADSFLISADNAHAVHPNHPEKADPTNRPYLNGGIVIKYHGSQKYTTDGISAARMKDYCERAKVPYQTYANRSDIAGGSTLGNISTAHVSVSSVDIGLPQLAMHSAVETAGMKDTEYAVRALKEFWGE